ncbi:MAG: hypothetical protein A2V66_02735 [Ignavibacteria bacterium RBG_13_36_8]|nr:MAG: hypothetical protein A2V66_02735 [Ignavibacteria bacterium RBG_13_36_8]
MRNHFPILKAGKIYFNHAAIGPLSDLVIRRLNKYIELRSTGEIENYPTQLEASKSAKEKLSRMFNTKPDRFSWIDSVSNGMNVLAQGIDWETGDRIILNDIEFPANVYPFLNLKKEGVEIDFAKSRNGKVDVEDIEKLITPKTKLVSISLVQFLSGYRTDVVAISELCKKHNVIFSVDAIQGAGAVQVDIQKSQIDFLCVGSHKWLMGLQGSSFFYISEELQERLTQKFVGWLSVVGGWDFTNYNLVLKSSAERFQNGSLNVIGIVALDESLNLFESIGMESIERRVLDNTEYFISELKGIGADVLMSSVPRKNLSGIVSVRHDSQKVFDELLKKNIYFSLRMGILRFSPHFYNTKEEIDSVVEEIKKVIT